jgi:hypothetical protein
MIKDVRVGKDGQKMTELKMVVTVTTEEEVDRRGLG